jgi:diacylglycerol kinase family enzyme
METRSPCTYDWPSTAKWPAGTIVLGAICNGRQRTFPPSAVAQVVAELLAGHGDGDYVERMRVPWMEVVAPAPIPVNLDGEPMNDTTFRFECVPGCIRMVLPASCPCLKGNH